MTTIEGWIERYRAAAQTDDPEKIAALFTEDAEYWDGPFGEPWRGHDEIIEKWRGQSDTTFETRFTYEVFAVDRSKGVVEGEYRYLGPGPQRTYRNAWLIELDDAGRARRFKDYWVEEPGAEG